MIQSFTLTNFNSGLDGLPYPCCPPPPPPPLPTDSLLNIPPNPPLIPPVEDKSDSKAKSNAEEGPSNSASAASDLFSASVSELRRKAQEHSAALWQLAQTVQQTQQNDEAKGEDGASGRSSVEEKEQEVEGVGNGEGEGKEVATK